MSAFELNNVSEIEALLLLNVLSPSRTKPVADRLLQGESSLSILEELKQNHLEQIKACLEKFNPKKELERCFEKRVQLVSLMDDCYPSLLKLIPDPPLVIYVKGKLSPSDRASVSLVGARRSTQYGISQARRFSCELASAGWAVVSGLAKGIDAAAHEGCLSISYGKTIAVLGCGIDVVYPSENERLYKQIEERGALISEFPLGARPLAFHFPRRNRIISGLSLGTFVLEAFQRSGSLITARQALEQGREVFALPGRVDELTSMGTHQLIREGATLIDSFETLNQELVSAFQSWKFSSEDVKETKENLDNRSNPELSILKNENRVADSSFLLGELSPTGKSFDELVEQKLITPTKLSMELIELELAKKIIRKADGLYYSLN